MKKLNKKIIKKKKIKLKNKEKEGKPYIYEVRTEKISGQVVRNNNELEILFERRFFPISVKNKTAFI